MKIDSIVRMISNSLDLEVNDVTGPGRNRGLVDCRRLICLICLDKGITEKELGEALNRDRTTINHLIESGKFFAETYPEFTAQYQAIKSKLA